MSVRACAEISRYVRGKVASLGYTNLDDRGKPEALYSLKDRLLYGRSDINILSAQRFQATLQSVEFNQAIRKDLFDGIVRIKMLEKAAEKLVKTNAATAWVITTCYYASFFAAVELLRCSGTRISYFDTDAMDKLTQRATSPVPSRLEEGTYYGTFNYDVTTGESKIVYVKQNIQQHQFTWNQFKQIVRGTRSNLTGIDAVRQELLERFIGNSSKPHWPSPSNVRNQWNYEDASLFGKNGERVGAEFRKLVSSRAAAMNWVGTRNIIWCKETHASAMAFVMSILIGAMEDVSNALLPDSLSKLVK